MKTCEEYVLNELKQTKEELALCKKRIEELEDTNNVMSIGYKRMIDLVVNGTKEFSLEDDGTYIKVYFNSSFIALERKDELGVLEPLIDLIEKGQCIVRREDDE